MRRAYSLYAEALEQCGYAEDGTLQAVALDRVSGFSSGMRRLLGEAHRLATAKARERVAAVRNEFDAFMARAEPFTPYVFPFPELDRDNLLSDANAAPNPSFEEDLAGWAFSSKTGAAVHEAVTGDAWHGSRMLAVTNPGLQRYVDAKCHIRVPVEPGALYRVRVMVRPDRAAIDSHAVAMLIVGGLERPNAKTGPALLADAWRPLNMAAARATGDSLSIVLRIHNGFGTWSFDGLQVHRLPRRADATGGSAPGE
jgi:hypothetical protein